MLLFDTENKDLKLKSVKRIRQNATKPRPIKITLYNVNDKAKVMKNLWKLKGKKLYEDISIKHDYTFTEREMNSNRKQDKEILQNLKIQIIFGEYVMTQKMDW